MFNILSYLMILPKDAKEVTITSTDYKMTMIHRDAMQLYVMRCDSDSLIMLKMYTQIL